MNYQVTGNEYIALPTLREADAALESLSFLHMGAKGMLELHGTQERPLLAPFVQREGSETPLTGLRWERLYSWIPRFTTELCGLALEGVLLTPIDERGFGWRLRATNREAEAEITLGLRGTWAKTLHSVNESKPVAGKKHLYPSGWNHCYVMDLRPGLSLFAFAPIYTEQP